MEPLDRGEHVDLDTAVNVRRNRSGNFYHVATPDGEVDLEDEEIRQIAELAGYTVTDDD